MAHCSLDQRTEKSRLISQQFSKLAREEYLQNRKNFSLQQLTAIIPERFSQAQCDQLVAQLVDPRRGEIE